MTTPAHDLERFYEFLAEVGTRLGGRRVLGDCTGRMSWRDRGVYFVFEPPENPGRGHPRPRALPDYRPCGPSTPASARKRTTSSQPGIPARPPSCLHFIAATADAKRRHSAKGMPCTTA